jgi:hypothetical protein
MLVFGLLCFGIALALSGLVAEYLKGGKEQ